MTNLWRSFSTKPLLRRALPETIYYSTTPRSVYRTTIQLPPPSYTTSSICRLLVTCHWRHSARHLSSRLPVFGTAMDSQGSMIRGVTSPTTSARPGTANSTKRKRSGLDFESSPGTGGEADDDGLERHTPRQPGVKRACNECRQQKVSHGAFIFIPFSRNLKSTSSIGPR